MKKIENTGLRLRCFYKRGREWLEIPRDAFTENGFLYEKDDMHYALKLKEADYGYDFELEEKADCETGATANVLEALMDLLWAEEKNKINISTI